MSRVLVRPAVVALAAGATALAAAAATRRQGTPASSAYPEVELATGRETSVSTDDGVRLHVVEFGAADAPLTVVFAHGYTLSLGCWHRQLRDLLDAVDFPVRILAYDQRGHGRSGPAPAGSATIDQLGRDLRAVLDQQAADGEVVLVGHSMGGMTIMAFAEQYPELIGTRVLGAALVSTSAGELAANTFGLPRPVAAVGRRLAAAGMQRAKRAELAGRRPRPSSPRATAWMLFGADPDPEAVALTHRLGTATSAVSTADFYATFADHDRLAALEALRGIPVLIVSGTRDRLCPPAHSQAMVRRLPHAEFVVYDGAGHMTMLERDADVTARLAALVVQARRARVEAERAS